MANNTGKKHGGREAGTPNKLTKEFKETLSNILSDEIEKLSETLQQLEPKERLDIIVKLLPYIAPKLQSIEYKDESVKNVTSRIEFVSSEEERRISQMLDEQV